MLRRSFLVLSAFLCDDAAIVLVFLTDFLHLSHCSLCNLAVSVKFLGRIDPATGFRGLFPLREKHLPFSHVIHGLILVRQEISFNEGTVLHLDAFPVRLFLALRFPLMKLYQCMVILLRMVLIGFLSDTQRVQHTSGPGEGCPMLIRS